MALSASQVPFTYTGKWEAEAYGNNKFYARLLTSGTFTPKMSLLLDVFLVGGGGAGVQGSGGGGGGGGYTQTYRNRTVSSATSVVIGAGGQPKYDGGETKFGTLKAAGGKTDVSHYSHGCPGGSGGGAGSGSSSKTGGRQGGSDGSDGGTGDRSGGAGQGTTTRAFEGDSAPFNTMLFSGGGGGGGSKSKTSSLSAGAGGDGGGGAGSGGNGVENTGGGGGGMYYNSTDSSKEYYAGSGGSGIVIVRGSLNTAPTVPGSITVPEAVKGGEKLSITWGMSSDVDGNLAGYQLERSVDGASFGKIYDGTAVLFQDDIIKGWQTVAYRVRAYDTMNAYSGYATSPTRTVINNTAPVISCSLSGDLGVKGSGFRVTYSVSDVDGDAVTVTEKMDGATVRSYNAVLGAENTFDVSEDFFQTLLNGAHTMVIEAKDSEGATDTRTLTWTKAVHACRITWAEPRESAEEVRRALVNIQREIPEGAEFRVLVTNNARDDAPVWEDATADVLAGRNHVFDNTAAARGFAFNFAVSAARREGGSGGCIRSIGGAFD